MWILITSDYDRAYHVQQVMEASYDALEYVIVPYPNDHHRLLIVDDGTVKPERVKELRMFALGACMSYRMMQSAQL